MMDTATFYYDFDRVLVDCFSRAQGSLPLVRKEVFEYLHFMSKEIVGFGGAAFVPEDAGKPSALFHIFGGKDVVGYSIRYVLSSERRYPPQRVSCSNEKVYGVVEDVLREEGRKLSRRFLEGWISNIRLIK